jgi:hypothetical protein
VDKAVDCHSLDLDEALENEGDYSHIYYELEVLYNFKYDKRV